MHYRLCWLCLLLPWLLVVTTRASAQSVLYATLSPPQTDEFPRVSAFLDVHDDQGRFVHGLQASDVTVLENSERLPVERLEEMRPGVQTVLVINPGRSFTIRNSQGLSRYDLLVETLTQWIMSRRGSTLDDLSLLIATGPEKTHVSNPLELLPALEGYKFEEGSLAPSLDILSQAMDIASDPAPKEGMERAVFFITCPLEGELTFGLQNLAVRASQLKVRVFVWLIASSDEFSMPQADQLAGFANQTGGQFFGSSASEPLPTLEAFLEPLRNLYRLTYISKIKSGGEQRLAVEIRYGDQKVLTAEQAFNLDLQPPDPAFISPALEIIRQPPAFASEERLSQGEARALLPAQHQVQILVDFPDGRRRSLERTRLYVDGVVVAENTTPPFDRFTWDLTQYAETGSHILKVEARDSLGLKGTSIETLVEVKVVQPGRSKLASLTGQLHWLLLLIVVFGCFILLLGLVLVGRLQPRGWKLPLGFRRAQRSKLDPLTQPVLPKGETGGRRHSGWTNRLHWPQRRHTPQVYAYLARLIDVEQAETPAPYPIILEELTLGSDPNQATLVLDDPSVEKLHARLRRQPDGTYRLADQGSVAGTWLNYSPVSQEGATLEHGDLIHVGRVGFRFTLRSPLRARRPVVTLEEA